eukprot:11784333-Prorocentrum_lima.AAC.1
MTSSLVGSEMCIRDRPLRRRPHHTGSRPTADLRIEGCAVTGIPAGFRNTVSYTHLTLPTICSV